MQNFNIIFALQIFTLISYCQLCRVCDVLRFTSKIIAVLVRETMNVLIELFHSLLNRLKC